MLLYDWKYAQTCLDAKSAKLETLKLMNNNDLFDG